MKTMKCKNDLSVCTKYVLIVFWSKHLFCIKMTPITNKHCTEYLSIERRIVCIIDGLNKKKIHLITFKIETHKYKYFKLCSTLVDVFSHFQIPLTKSHTPATTNSINDNNNRIRMASRNILCIVHLLLIN